MPWEVSAFDSGGILVVYQKQDAVVWAPRNVRTELLCKWWLTLPYLGWDDNQTFNVHTRKVDWLY